MFRTLEWFYVFAVILPLALAGVILAVVGRVLCIPSTIVLWIAEKVLDLAEAISPES